VAGCPSCCQPVLKTSTGPRPFFSYQQTPEEGTALPLSSMSARHKWQQTIEFNQCSNVLTDRGAEFTGEIIKTWHVLFDCVIR